MENWPRGLAHEREENLRLEALGVVLWCFEFNTVIHFLARLPDGRHATAGAPVEFPSFKFDARNQVRECARAELGKARTPAHVTFFKNLDRKRDQ
jgi:hypothetical protein